MNYADSSNELRAFSVGGRAADHPAAETYDRFSQDQIGALCDSTAEYRGPHIPWKIRHPENSIYHRLKAYWALRGADEPWLAALCHIDLLLSPGPEWEMECKANGWGSFSPKSLRDLERAFLPLALPNAQRIIERCPQMAMIHALRGNVSEPYWWAALSITEHATPNLSRVCSDGYPHFSEAEFDYRVSRIHQEERKPALCGRLDSTNPGICPICRYKDIVRSPIALGYEHEPKKKERHRMNHLQMLSRARSYEQFKTLVPMAYQFRDIGHEDFVGRVLRIGRTFDDTFANAELNELLGVSESGGTTVSVSAEEWPDPADIKESLPPVIPFDPRWLPQGIRKWVLDVADRLSCPADFPAVVVMTALGSAIGSRLYCKPYENGTWKVPTNLWATLVAQPGAMKSPVMHECLRPLVAMDKRAAEAYKLAIEKYQFDKAAYEVRFKTAVKNSGPQPTQPQEPQMARYLVNDSTYEMLVAIAAANPRGFMVLRDELAGWFHSLEKENQKEARGLYLTGWSGTDGYATDRIGRGHVRADQVVISLLGSIQPNVLRDLIQDAVSGGSSDDGLIQRFQLAVYPDTSRLWTKVDRKPDLAAEAQYIRLIEQFAKLDVVAAGASYELDGTPYLPFSPDAQGVFDQWREALEYRIRAGHSEEHPVMLAHLGKYRSLFPKLALLLHLAAGDVGPISRTAAERACCWIVYLESHAKRIYHTATNRTMLCASTLANKIKAGRLPPVFTRSDVLLKEWANLRKADEVGMAVTVLRDMNWLSVTEDRRTGGRPAERYHINPKVKRAA